MFQLQAVISISMQKFSSFLIVSSIVFFSAMGLLHGATNDSYHNLDPENKNDVVPLPLGVLVGVTPGNIPGTTPGINPLHPDVVVPPAPGVLVGFTPGNTPGTRPGIDPLHPDAVFTPAGFTPGVIKGYNPGLNSYEINKENRDDLEPIAKNAHIQDNTDYRINGSLESQGFTVTRKGSITGSGVIETKGNSVDQEGKIKLDQADKIEIHGDLNQHPDSTTTVTQGGHIGVIGKTTLGGNLHVASLRAGEKMDFLDSTDSIKGSYDSITIDGHPELRGILRIVGDPHAYVLAAPKSYTLFAQNQNQINVAGALDAFINSTHADQRTVSDALDELHSWDYSSALNQIIPTLYQSLSTIAFNIDNAQNQELIQRLWGLRLAGASGTSGFSMSGFPDSTPILETQENKKSPHRGKDILLAAPDNHWGVFVDGNGIFAQATSANLLSTYNAESGGVTTGLTYQWNRSFSSGLYTGYQGVYSKYSGGSSLVDNQVNFGLFGTYGEPSGKGLFLDALVGGAYDNYQMNRSINFGSGESAISRTATGTPGAGELNTMLASGYDIKYNNWTFGPLSSLQYQYFGANSFNETGANSLDLNTTGWNTSSLIYSLGSHLAYNCKLNKNILLIPQLSLGWQHQFLENPYTINSSFSGGNGQTFGNTSSAPLRDTLYTGIGMTVEFNKTWNSSFFYNSAAGNRDVVSQNIFWSLGMKF